MEFGTAACGLEEGMERVGRGENQNDIHTCANGTVPSVFLSEVVMIFIEDSSWEWINS